MQIHYFPYLSLGDVEEINFGNVKVWNFEKKVSQYISDQKLREYIESIVYSNIYNGKPIKDVGIISIGNTDFREFTAEERKTADEIRLVLFLSFLYRHNTQERGANAGWNMGTSENFEYVIQNFQPYSEYISERNGRIITITTGGYKIGEKKFFAPPFVIKPFRFSFDGRFLHHLLNLKKRGGVKLYRRILKAIDLFYESYYNNPNVSDNARVLLQVACFETLLDLPLRDGRKVFKDKIEAYCNLSKEKNYLHHYETPSGRNPERRSRKAIWADVFYTLRNHIIHGDVVRSEDFIFKGKQQHLDIAVLFLALLIKKLINEKFKKKLFYDEITWGKTNDGPYTYEGFIYKDNDLTRLLSEELSKHRKKL